MMDVFIITPLSRPENFFKLLDSIRNDAKPYVNAYWVIVADFEEDFTDRMPEPDAEKFKNEILPYLIYNKISISLVPSEHLGISGNPQRNHGLDLISGSADSYVYFLDDDNLIHPQLFKVISEYFTKEPGKAFVVNQVFKNGKRRLQASPNNIRVGGIDTAQVVLPVKLIGNTRWQNHNYCADGEFIGEIYRNNPDKFLFLNLDISYYNYLR